MRSKKELNVQIGQEVRNARDRARLTQEQLAERLDCSPQYVSDLERGVVGISIPMLRNLCMELGITSDSILFSEDSTYNLNIISERCKTLSEDQFKLLLGIIRNFIEAIQMELQAETVEKKDSPSV